MRRAFARCSRCRQSTTGSSGARNQSGSWFRQPGFEPGNGEGDDLPRRYEHGGRGADAAASTTAGSEEGFNELADVIDGQLARLTGGIGGVEFLVTPPDGPAVDQQGRLGA